MSFRVSSHRVTSYFESHRVTSDFRTFIISILKRAQLSQKTIDALTDEESMVVFRKAFTHASYDPEFNYEFLEFRGDVVVNFVIVQYIRTKFPKIVSVKWLTKLKHNLASKNNLAKIAFQGKFLENIHYGAGIELLVERGKHSKVNEIRYYENVEILSMLEDTFEALAGAIVQVVDKKYHHGVGLAVSFAVISTFFDMNNISLRWDAVFDAKSRLKEIYDQLGWNIEQNISNWLDKNKPNRQHVSKIYGYPKGDKTPTTENKHMIGKGTGSTAQLAQGEAADRAIAVLKKDYQIEGVIPNPYSEPVTEGELPKVPNIPEGFIDEIYKLLKRARVKSESIKDFTDESSLFEFRMSLVDKSYDTYVNHNMYKFIGITVVDLAIAEYLGNRFPHIVSEKWLTNIKHNIISQGVFSTFVQDAGFDKYILYGIEMKENMVRHPHLSQNTGFNNMLEGAFKAFMGALVVVVDSKRQQGVGYVVAYNLISSFMDQIVISTKYTDVFNSKSRLKELYDKNKWGFKESITIVHNEETGEYDAEIIGFPLNDRRHKEENKKSLAKASAHTKKEAEQKASDIAIKVLDRTYRIREIPSDPTRISSDPY